MRLLKSLILIFVISLFFISPITAFAQTPDASASDGTASFGVARLVEIAQKDLKDGSIVTATQKGAVASSTPYDSQVLGVVARDAAIVLDTSDSQNAVPVISTGTVELLVSTSAGPIKKGDLLTTSTIPGVAVKATKDGYVLGTALEDDANPNTKQVDKIAIELELHYFNSKPTFIGTLTDILKLAVLPTKDSPAAIFKYIVAAIVVIGSLVLGFISFGRTAAKGVEALGRNPAASRVINLGIIFNVFIVVIIVLAGLTVAFLILRL